jgi:hypothetical protein
MRLAAFREAPVGRFDFADPDYRYVALAARSCFAK